MAKTKEQVKYNPKLSVQRRFSKAKRAVSPGNTVLTIIIVILAAFMVAIMGYEVIFETEYVIADGAMDTIGAFAFSGMFMLLFAFALNTSLPGNFLTQKNQKQQQALSKGCVYFHELFMHMPVKKIILYKQSFRWYLFFMVGCGIPVVVLNILNVIDSAYSAIAPVTALATILEGVVIVFFYLGYFCVFHKNAKYMKSLLITGVSIFYIVWFGCMFGFLDFLAEFKALGKLAGVPSLCITFAAVAVVIIIEKCIVEKKAVNAPWEFYTEEAE